MKRCTRRSIRRYDRYKDDKSGQKLKARSPCRYYRNGGGDGGGACAGVALRRALTAALALALTGALGGKKGAAVTITEDGKTQEYPLGENRTITLRSLTVVIENGEAYVINPDCPDKICEHSGRISRVNQSIVCLPAGVVVGIKGAGEFQTDTGQEK